MLPENSLIEAEFAICKLTLLVVYELAISVIY
jgi:hypothetical protein